MIELTFQGCALTGFLFTFLVAVYLTSLKAVFGTFSLSHVISRNKKKSEYKRIYDELFTSRNGFLYHISWAKSRGDFEIVESLTKELQNLDLVS